MSRSTVQHSFFAHFEEFRGRVLKILAVFALTSVVFYPYSPLFLDFIVAPVKQLVFTSPAEAFLAHIAATFLGGFIVSLPFTVYQVWAFVASALTPREKKNIMVYGPLSAVFFLAGIVFAFFVVVPFSFNFLLGFATSKIVPMITVNHYMSFVGTMTVAFGVVFELPLVLAFLTKIGVATPEFLKQKRRHAIMINLLISAIITPPDVMSLILMAVPMLVLYEIGVVFSRIVYARKIAILRGEGNAA